MIFEIPDPRKTMKYNVKNVFFFFRFLLRIKSCYGLEPIAMRKRSTKIPNGSFVNSNEHKIDSFNCFAIQYQTCVTGSIIEKRLINSGVILLIIIVSIV